MSNLKIFDSRAGAYVGPAGEWTTFATQLEAFRHIFDVLAPIPKVGSAPTTSTSTTSRGTSRTFVG